MLKSFKSLFGPQPQESTQTEQTEKPSWLGQLIQNLPFQTASDDSKEPALSGMALEDAYEALEDALIKADLGVDLALQLVDDIRKAGPNPTQAQLKDRLAQQLKTILQPIADKTQLTFDPNALNIHFMVGVNGVGKTTMIGKLAYAYQQQGYRVLIAAGDTFRAAAVEQLQVWAERANVDFISLEEGKGNAAAVVFDALQRVKAAKAEGNPYNVLLIDTAGRLQNKFNLMEELKNLKDVIEKEAPLGYTIERLLVLDATTGQNALQQVKLFQDAVDLSGLVLTKYDGSAKGGILYAIVREFAIPIKLLGTGEKITDWDVFSVDAALRKLV
jgi:fused signal recognition particle receptor